MNRLRARHPFAAPASFVALTKKAWVTHIPGSTRF